MKRKIRITIGVIAMIIIMVVALPFMAMAYTLEWIGERLADSAEIVHGWMES